LLQRSVRRRLQLRSGAALADGEGAIVAQPCSAINPTSAKLLGRSRRDATFPGAFDMDQPSRPRCAQRRPLHARTSEPLALLIAMSPVR
jgi:hypothetical protein